LTTAKPQPGDGGEPPMSDVQVLRSARRSKVIYVRIPKKVGQKLRYNYGDDEGSEEEGWGILFEEGFKVHRLLFAILIIYVSGSLAFLGWMLHSFGGITTSTWSGYIAVISWVLSLFSLKVTVWFKWAENY
jgi:hypothetical protein